MVDSIAEEVKIQRLAILNARQRDIQRVNYGRHLEQTLTVMVEHAANSRGQITGRSTQNKTVNFTCDTTPAIGSYVDVRITQVFPNSLVGEAISVPIAPSAALLAQQALNARVTVLG
jgi:tRNA-2-methylthio-N6-dimethylallyladenosine synthase